jgi:hypothetical protein
MLFDTGSNWLWVGSRICKDCDGFGTLFDERNSSSFYFYNLAFDEHYGSGSVYGYISND